MCVYIVAFTTIGDDNDDDDDNNYYYSIFIINMLAEQPRT
jgi:hypothetical protein